MSKESKQSTKRIAEPGKRHRRLKALVEVEEVAPPTPAQLGTAHLYTVEVLEGGPRALIRAEHEAARLSAKFGEEIEAKWCLATKYLLELAQGDAIQRARARYALQWRPRYLAVVSLTRSLVLGARAARIARQTALNHRAADQDFDAQIIAAQEQAVDLLADMTMRSAIEGECKPIYWQGILVGHQREFDNRLRIEMLRAYRPETFKTPGSKVSVSTGPNIFGSGNVVCDAGAVSKLMGMRAISLAKIEEKQAQARVVDPLALMAPDPAQP